MLEHFAIVFCTLENLPVGFSRALRIKESHFLSKNVFRENAVGYLRKLWMSEHFVIVFSTLENLLVGISGPPAMTVIHFLSKNLFWENAVGNLRYGED